jgi:ABC-type cobalamin/Fe3+-siderophores transport systems, ATPase components
MYFGFKDLTVKYKERTVINKLSLELAEGEVTTVVGVNGAGKTTLLKAFMRAVAPSAGYAEYRDANVLSYSVKEFAKTVAFLPQKHHTPAGLDVQTLVEQGRFPLRRAFGFQTKEDKEAVSAAIKLFGLEELKYRKLSTLSGGEAQRAWLAMTVCRKPKILILDEPTVFLDLNSQFGILKLIRSLNRESGYTVLMVLHDLQLASNFSDKIAVLDGGRLYSFGAPGEVITKKMLEEVFNVRAEVAVTDERKITLTVSDCL